MSEVTNPATLEVASPEERLEALFSGGKKSPDEGKDDEPTEDADEQDDDEADAESDDEPAEEVSDDDSEAGDDAEKAEPEEVTIEVDGKEWTVPKALEGAFLKSKDYTQKTQELAEQRKQVEERAKFSDEMGRFRAAAFEKSVELRAMEAQLKRFADLDWDGLARAGGAEYNLADRAYRELQSQHSREVAGLQQLAQQQQQASAAAMQKAVAEGAQVLAKDIKGWSPELATKISANAMQYGFTPEELEAVVDPRYVKALHDAYQWRQLQAAKPDLKRKVADVKPVTVKASRTSQNNQEAQQADKARAKLKQTGKGADAEEALFHLFQRSRKR